MWNKIWTWIKTAGKKVIAPVAVVALVLFGGFLLISGVKGIQLGGLLGMFLGKPKPSTKAQAANTIPPGRVDAQGNLIPLGKPDALGKIQVPVVSIEPQNPFSDPDVVSFIPPNSNVPVQVHLPVGVKASNVDKVVVVSPSDIVVTVKDNSKVSAQEVDDVLATLNSLK